MKACNDKYPKGLEHEAWNNLQKKYSKTDILLASKLRQELHRLKLKEEGDPTDLFEKMATIQIQSRKITDDIILEKNICLKTITTAPNMYMLVMRNFCKEKGSNLEIENPEEEMRELYRMCNINEETEKERDKKDEAKETTLAAPGKGWCKF